MKTLSSINKIFFILALTMGLQAIGAQPLPVSLPSEDDAPKNAGNYYRDCMELNSKIDDGSQSESQAARIESVCTQKTNSIFQEEADEPSNESASQSENQFKESNDDDAQNQLASRSVDDNSAE
jgi:hypothetical protein